MMRSSLVALACGSAHAFAPTVLAPRRGAGPAHSTPDGRSNDVFHIQNTPRAPMGSRGPRNLIYQTIAGERAAGQVPPHLMNSAGVWNGLAAIQGERARDAYDYNVCPFFFLRSTHRNSRGGLSSSWNERKALCFLRAVSFSLLLPGWF